MTAVAPLLEIPVYCSMRLAFGYLSLRHQLPDKRLRLGILIVGQAPQWPKTHLIRRSSYAP